MNKRIRKKKAKQAELKKQQELEWFLKNPEQIRELFEAVSTAIGNVFKNLDEAFANVAEQWRKWGEQIDKENSK